MNQQTIWRWNLLAYNIGGYVKRFVYFFTKREVFKSINKNHELFKQDNANKKAYLCALGPSLKNVDIDRIVGDTIVVNRFYKFGQSHPDFIPTYYLMLDGNLTDPENVSDFEEAINQYVNKGTIYILNSKLSHYPLLKSIPQNKLYFVTCIDGRVRVNKEYKINGIHPAFMNVAGEAILLLMLMGYKDISLLGCDFNSFASAKQVHCYKDASQKRLWSMSEELYAYSIAAQDHSDLAILAKNIQCRIVNSTKGSLIDAYPLIIEEDLYLDCVKDDSI